ncbi:MAG: hypothetical protein OHK0039_10130 [Bacteroidia bacterium]
MKSFPAHTEGVHVGGYLLPDGAEVIPDPNGDAVTFIMPTGYVVLYTTAEGRLGATEKLKYTCSCNGAGACDVINFGHTFGCLQGTCLKQCIGGFTDPGDPDTRLAGTMAFADMEAGISWITGEDQGTDLLPFDPLLLQHQDIARTWERFRELHGLMLALYRTQEGTQDDQTQVVALNFYGTMVGVKVPLDFATNYRVSGQALKQVSCSCSQGNGCTYRQLGDDLHVCGGYDCTTCTMTVEYPSEK